MNILSWPEHERPREKLLALGAHALSDAELVAILIGSGTRGRNAVDLGRDLIRNAGSLRSLLDLRTGMPRPRGVGKAKASRLMAGLELARRCLAEDLRRDNCLTNPLDSAAYLRARLHGYPYEVFASLFLDTRNRVIAFEELFRGTVDGTMVHAREVVRACMRHNAAAIIVAHNHPSGECEPSEADRMLTLELRQAVGLIGVRLLDHFVIGAGAPVSMAQRGWL
ncbi:RadC family protein [Tahibacter soli]|jgi:DNA repair protein RadC|uniref:DNA repair protein RadC n=1 Tax=Tahibacter soli TaxID=2983605 RepID=A0A9X3YK88_9GAMM|nr:DNA repair protein RadC [Tahibacter soli]MDC8013144.1 DNA repair protein RadC [Tahibacter soli]